MYPIGILFVAFASGFIVVDAFLIPLSGNNYLLNVPSQRLSSSSSSSAGTCHPSYGTTATGLLLQKGWFTPDGDDDDAEKDSSKDDDDNDNDDDVLVTREMLHRDLLEDPQVKRKRKSGGYKPLDNRDHLPFAVRKVTPDPYTRPEVKKKLSKQQQQQQQPLKGGKRKTTDLDRHMAPSSSLSKRPPTTASRLYQSKDGDGTNPDTSTLLGEFQLDKSTTSGDVIVLGDKEYQVQSARCQYRYAGGQRFVMVRKILEVKEVTRVYKEEALMRQYKSSPSSRSIEQPPQLE